jgi:hypothetical protein
MLVRLNQKISQQLNLSIFNKFSKTFQTIKTRKGNRMPIVKRFKAQVKYFWNITFYPYRLKRS